MDGLGGPESGTSRGPVLRSCLMDPLAFSRATADDAGQIAGLRNAAAEALTVLHGEGHWSTRATEKGVRRSIHLAHVLVARRGGELIGALTLGKQKPWAIDPSYFTTVAHPLYLTDMAVTPAFQGQGIGRAMMTEAAALARSLGGQAIRLDAYDAPAGAGGFYGRCGMREVGRVTYRGTPLVYFELLLSGE